MIADLNGEEAEQTATEIKLPVIKKDGPRHGNL